MTNRQHLDILHEGVKTWNQWRQEHLDIGPDLNETNLSEIHLEGADLSEVHLKEARLGKAHLEEANLSRAHLEKTDLSRAYLKETNLSIAHLEGANLDEADLEGANLNGAHLEGASLNGAHLEGASLNGAHLEGASLNKTYLGGANLSEAFFSNTSRLHDVTLNDEGYGAPSLVDVRWGDVNLAVVDWTLVKVLGDEQTARQAKTPDRRIKYRTTRTDEYRTAVRANRQLAVVLRDQGLNEEADHFAYHAQLLQRAVWLQQGRPLKCGLSWFLYLLAGYGYRPGRSILIYLLVILGFAWAYFQLGQMEGHPFSPDGALVFSLTSFHGRGFFPGGLRLEDVVTKLAAFEAVIGLLVEIGFIATFTQRFFGR